MGLRLARRTATRVLLAAWAVATAAVPPAAALDPDRALTQYLSEQWTSRHGLPSNTVQAIAQTPDGFLWVGTQTGLARFDGARFVEVAPAAVRGLKGASVLALFVARDGALWVGTGTGLVVRVAGQRADVVPAADPAIAPTRVRAIVEDASGGVWVGAWEGLYRVRGGLLHLVAADTWGVHHLAVDAGGVVWGGARNGLVRVDGSDVRVLDDGDGLPRTAIHGLQPARGGGLWVGVTGLLLRERGGRFEQAPVSSPVPGPSIRALLEDRDGNVWVGGWGGLGRYRQGRFEPMPRRPGLMDQVVVALFEDRDGSLWIGTRGGGLTRFRDPAVVTHSLDEGLTLSDVQGVLADRRGRVWVGAGAFGVDRLDGGRWEHLGHTPLGQRQLFSIAEDEEGRVWFALEDGLVVLDGERYLDVALPGRPRDGAVQSVVAARGGGVWIASAGKLFRAHGRQARPVPLDTGEAGAVDLIFGEAADGTLRYGSNHGLALARDGRARLAWRSDTEDHRPVALAETADGALWLGTRGKGLVRLHAGQVTTFGRAAGLPNDYVGEVLTGQDGALWVATHFGIARVPDPVAQAGPWLQGVTVLGLEEGMRSNYSDDTAQPVGAVAPDGRIWIVTTNGVVVVDPRRLPQAAAPPAAVVERLVIDGRAVASGGSAPPGEGTVEAEFTAPALVAAQRVRFRYRLDGFDAGWMEAGERRAVRYTNLPPGTYRFELEARHETGAWTRRAAPVSFTLQPHFHQTLWARWLAFLAVVAAVGTFVAWRSRRAEVRARDLQLVVDRRTADLRREVEQHRATEAALRASEQRVTQAAWALQLAHDELEQRVRARTSELELEVAERRRAEAALVEARDAAEAANRAKSAFLATMSHELRTPLNAVIGYASLVADELAERGVAEPAGDLERIRAAGVHLLDLVNDVLDVSRIEAGRLDLNLGVVDVASVVEDVVALLQPQARTNGNRLSVAGDAPPMPPMVTDGMRLKQILVNLVSNACKFTTGGEVSVRAWVDADPSGAEWLQVSVTDTGIGIDPADRDKLFRAFSQVDASISRRHGGTGLGLVLSRRLCHLLGGDISVESEPGRGSRFVVRLPAAPQPGTWAADVLDPPALTSPDAA